MIVELRLLQGSDAATWFNDEMSTSDPLLKSSIRRASERYQARVGWLGGCTQSLIESNSALLLRITPTLDPRFGLLRPQSVDVRLCQRTVHGQHGRYRIMFYRIHWVLGSSSMVAQEGPIYREPGPT